MKDTIEQVMKEIHTVLTKVKENEAEALIQKIAEANIVITCGAGRMGLAARSFSMRLGQLGKMSYSVGDASVPHCGTDDLLIICSGSGETETIHTVAKIAKKNGCNIALVTCHRVSKIAKLADIIIIIPARSKLNNEGKKSIQPMTTLMEQCTHLFFDALVLKLMKKMNQSSDDMWERHSNLE